MSSAFPDALTYIAVLPNAARGSRRDTVSQLHGTSYVTLLSVCTRPYRRSSRSLCGRRRELVAIFFFFSYTLLSLLIIFLVSHATVTQMHTVFERGHRAASLQGRGVEDPLRLRAQCEASRNPMLNTE